MGRVEGERVEEWEARSGCGSKKFHVLIAFKKNIYS